MVHKKFVKDPEATLMGPLEHPNAEDGNNSLHDAMTHGHVAPMDKIIELCPHLATDINEQGLTPPSICSSSVARA